MWGAYRRRTLTRGVHSFVNDPADRLDILSRICMIQTLLSCNTDCIIQIRDRMSSLSAGICMIQTRMTVTRGMRSTAHSPRNKKQDPQWSSQYKMSIQDVWQDPQVGNTGAGLVSWQDPQHPQWSSQYKMSCFLTRHAMHCGSCQETRPAMVIAIQIRVVDAHRTCFFWNEPFQKRPVVSLQNSEKYSDDHFGSWSRFFWNEVCYLFVDDTWQTVCSVMNIASILGTAGRLKRVTWKTNLIRVSCYIFRYMYVLSWISPLFWSLAHNRGGVRKVQVSFAKEPYKRDVGCEMCNTTQ